MSFLKTENEGSSLFAGCQVVNLRSRVATHSGKAKKGVNSIRKESLSGPVQKSGSNSPHILSDGLLSNNRNLCSTDYRRYARMVNNAKATTVTALTTEAIEASLHAVILMSNPTTEGSEQTPSETKLEARKFAQKGSEYSRISTVVELQR